jgi:hypothetical protein
MREMFSSQSGASGSSGTTSAPIASATVRAAPVGNCAWTKIARGRSSFASAMSSARTRADGSFPPVSTASCSIANSSRK